MTTIGTGNQTLTISIDDLRKRKIAALEAEVRRLSLIVCTGNPKCPACATVYQEGFDPSPICVRDIGLCEQEAVSRA